MEKNEMTEEIHLKGYPRPFQIVGMEMVCLPSNGKKVQLPILKWVLCGKSLDFPCIKERMMVAEILAGNTDADYRPGPDDPYQVVHVETAGGMVGARNPWSVVGYGKEVGRYRKEKKALSVAKEKNHDVQRSGRSGDVGENA